MELDNCTYSTGKTLLIKDQLKERYKNTFKKLCMLSSYSKYRPSFMTHLHKFWTSCSVFCYEMFNQTAETPTYVTKQGIKIEHLKIWCQDKHLSPELTVGFFCNFIGSHEEEPLINGRKLEAKDSTCLQEILKRKRYLIHLIDLCDVDEDGVLCEDEFLCLMLQIHETCRCEHSCTSLIDAIPVVNKHISNCMILSR